MKDAINQSVNHSTSPGAGTRAVPLSPQGALTVKRRVVVTGLGLVTPIGNTVDTTWSALLSGRSGADFITRFDASKLPVRFAAEIKGFDPLNYMGRKEVRRTGVFIHYCIAASDEAMRDSGLCMKTTDGERVGVCIGSGIGDMLAFEREHLKLLRQGPQHISPVFIPSAVINLAAGYVSIRFGAKGPNTAPATACTSGATAVGQGFRIIERGDADVMLCGGTESTTARLSIAGFDAMRSLSLRNEAPALASRPFEKDHDGFVMGEGAGILLLEELEHALARGARVYAEVVGYGAAADAESTVTHNGSSTGLVRAMRLALRDAGVVPEAVAYIQAHGTSVPSDDVFETKSLKETFGSHAYSLKISATKSMTGHMLGASGSVEAAFAVLAIHRGVLPPTINHVVPDPLCDLDYLPNGPCETRVEYALNNCFGFGGTHIALLFKRYK